MVDRFITIRIVGVGILILDAPKWVLQALGGNNVHKFGAITAFIMIFWAWCHFPLWKTHSRYWELPQRKSYYWHDVTILLTSISILPP